MGNYEYAITCAGRIEDEYDYTWLIEDLLDICLEQENPAMAIELSSLMRDSFYQTEALTEVALFFVRNENFVEAFNSIHLITNASYQTYALIDIATVPSAAARPLREEEQDGLSLIVMDQFPMDVFWEAQNSRLK
jgi:hypothetical protein